MTQTSMTVTGPDRAAGFDDGEQRAPFGALLRHYRKRARLTQNELAGLSSVSLRTIRNLEGGRATNPRPDTVHLLADGLRLSAEARADLSLAVGHDPVGAALTASLLRLPAGGAAGWAPTGRDRELRSLSGLVRTRGTRVVTVAGFSGVGKSRLAAALVSTLHREHRTPWLWLAPNRDGVPELVPDPVAGLASAANPDTARTGDGAFDLWLRGLATGDPAAIDELALLIGDRAFMLVLDGADRSGPGLDAAVAALLARCPRLSVLETARRTRPREGRLIVPLAPLRASGGSDAGQTGSGALDLLLPLIRVQDPDFEETPEHLARVLDVCRALDGLPRALESAAAWFALYSPAEVARAARRDPSALAAPGGIGPVGGLPGGWVREGAEEATAGLSAAGRALLARLAAEDRPWTTDRAEALARPESDTPDSSWAPAVETVYELLTLGLIRPARFEDGSDLDTPAPSDQRRRFTVLNLLRQHLL